MDPAPPPPRRQTLAKGQVRGAAVRPLPTSTARPPTPRSWRAPALFTALIALTALLGARLGAWYQDQLEQLDAPLHAITTFRPLDTVFVYDRHGAPFDRFHLEQRIRVDLASLPPHLSAAFLAAEDRRFHEHDGVDWRAVLRAAWVNQRDGKVVQGGSTLAQQLVKQLALGNERSYRRKLREAIAARALTQRLGRHRLLELYLNFVYLGHGQHGVEAAAQAYFARPAAELSPGQAATLATLVPAPELRNPLVDPEGARQRRDTLLRVQVELGWLTAAQAEAGMQEPIASPPTYQRAELGDAYRTEVRRHVAALLGTDLPHRLGLRVHSAYDPAVQSLVERAVNEGSEAVSRAAGLRVLGESLDSDARAAFLAAAPPALEGCHEALALGGDRLALGTTTLELPSAELRRLVRPRPTRARADPPPQPLATLLRAGDLLRVCLHDGAVRLDDRPWVQGAALVLDHRTGELLGVSGGRDVPLEGFVRATQARRQAGSTFKTFAYAASLTNGYTPESVLVDQPLKLDLGAGRTWEPKNFGEAYAGPVTLRRALASSLNSVAVQLTVAVGPDRVAAQARMMGVQSPIPEVPAIALGAVDVSPLDLALAYAVIANGGERRDPVWVRELHNRDGAVLGRAGSALIVDGSPALTLPGSPTRVLATETAAQLRDMLTAVVHEGSGRVAQHPTEPRHGKTGTSDDAVDAWFIGSTPQHTIAVWLGADDRTSLGRATTGGQTAGPVWRAIADGLRDLTDP